jgi:hypothetical protein
MKRNTKPLKRPRKQRLRKKLTPFEKALIQLPKLSVAECHLLSHALQQPTTSHINYIRRHYQKDEGYRGYSFVGTVDFNAPVQIIPEKPEYGQFVKDRWRPYSRTVREKYLRPLTITDKPEAQ